MAELTSMRNIGREMARKLTAAGIDTPGKLLQAGAKQAFFQLATLYPNVCLVHLYALEGAVRDVDLNSLPEGTKEDLREFNGALRGKRGSAP